MKTILLVPLRDYYQSRKRIWVKYLIPVVLGLLALAGALIFNIGNEETIRSTFSEFVNVQINVVAILVSFSVAIISILVTADNANTKSLKEEMTLLNISLLAENSCLYSKFCFPTLHTMSLLKLFT